MTKKKKQGWMLLIAAGGLGWYLFGRSKKEAENKAVVAATIKHAKEQSGLGNYIAIGH